MPAKPLRRSPASPASGRAAVLPRCSAFRVTFQGSRIVVDTPVPARSKPSRAILVFVRAPEAGAVKTRLAAAIGDDAALRIYRRLAEHTVCEAAALDADGVQLRLQYTPADAGDDVRGWLGARAFYLPQAEGDLGARMEDAFARAFADGADQVVIVGSDLPEMSAALLRQAFALLDAHPAVLGPARDGGYYLLGLTRPVGGVFDGIAWSTPDVLAATIKRFHAAGIEPALLDELGDVDEVEDVPEGWLAELSAAEVGRAIPVVKASSR
ncbi:MAG TPA: TIGR04282 family arsenosugar biosynthesis glycosyltransferase [Longimicrobium sp.]|nr:TIGR04282 family arsenosugar biosynthesis glycosyltransferase [Longimicrobium sp.]